MDTSDPKEDELQKAVGTATMYSYRIAQPLIVTLNLEVVLDVPACSDSDAIEQFKKTPQSILIDAVQNRLDAMLPSSFVSAHNSHSNHVSIAVSIGNAINQANNEKITVIKRTPLEEYHK